MAEAEDWDIVVKPKSSLFSLNFKEVFAYKDLIFLLVSSKLEIAFF